MINCINSLKHENFVKYPNITASLESLKNLYVLDAYKTYDIKN